MMSLELGIKKAELELPGSREGRDWRDAEEKEAKK